MKQDVHCPLDVAHQVVLLYVTTKELLKDIPVNKILGFKDEFIKYFDINYCDIVDKLRNGGDISMDDGIRIEEAVNGFAKFFMGQCDE